MVRWRQSKFWRGQGRKSLDKRFWCRVNLKLAVGSLTIAGVHATRSTKANLPANDLWQGPRTLCFAKRSMRGTERWGRKAAGLWSVERTKQNCPCKAQGTDEIVGLPKGSYFFSPILNRYKNNMLNISYRLKIIRRAWEILTEISLRLPVPSGTGQVGEISSPDNAGVRRWTNQGTPGRPALSHHGTGPVGEWPEGLRARLVSIPYPGHARGMVCGWR